MAALVPGTQLKRGTFVITSELGRGGFGEVFLAQQPRMGRDVAIKVLLPHVAENEEAVTRFEREARAAASLLHPNVLPVFDFDFDEETGVWFLAMQYVPGGHTLLERLGAPLAVAEVARIVAAVAGALDAAHDHDIVHRDVKPANVLMDGERPLLTDFGIAHLGLMASLTATGMAVGTPAYMSPEQALGKEIGPKADQYALGVMTYEMLAGRLPFLGDPLSLIHQQVANPPPPLAQFNPSVSAAVRAAVVLAMSKDPDDRFPTCTEFAADLLAAANLGTTSGSTSLPASAVMTAPARPIEVASPASSAVWDAPLPPREQPADRAHIEPAAPPPRAAAPAPVSAPPARVEPSPAPRVPTPVSPAPAAPVTENLAPTAPTTNNRFRIIFVAVGVALALLLLVIGIIVGEPPRPSANQPNAPTQAVVIATHPPVNFPAPSGTPSATNGAPAARIAQGTEIR